MSLSAPSLTDRIALARARARRNSEAMFLQLLARDGIEERLAVVNRPLTRPAVVTGHPEIWQDLRPGIRVIADGDVLALEEGAHDLVVHAMALHWSGDPVGQLIQCRRALAPDGLFLAVFFGGQTLAELRAALAEAEAAATGGLSPRILPMAEIRDAGGLLQRAGFTLPVAVAERQQVQYRSALHLMHDLRAMGEANAMQDRSRRFSRRDVLLGAAARYPADAEGRVTATFEMLVLTGWSPGPDQPQPLRPGSAAARLADVLGTREAPLSDTGRNRV